MHARVGILLWLAALAGPAAADVVSPSASTDLGVADTASPSGTTPELAAPATASTAGEPAPTAPAPTTDLSRRRDRDPASGRMLYSPTAITTAPRHVTIELRAPAAPLGYGQVRYGVIDRVEVGAALAVSDGDGGTVGYELMAKGQVWRDGRVALAAGYFAQHASRRWIHNPYLVGTGCFGDDCLGTASITVATQLGRFDEATPITVSAGLTIGRTVQFVSELLETYAYGQPGPLSGYVGARYAHPRVAIDLGAGLYQPSPGDNALKQNPMAYLGAAFRL